MKACILAARSKPDGIYYDGSCGMIVDTKAYAKGYALPVGQADEMIRYIEENKNAGTDQRQLLVGSF